MPAKMTAEWRQLAKLTDRALRNAMQLPDVAASFAGAVASLQLVINAREEDANTDRQLQVDLGNLTDEMRTHSPALARTWGRQLRDFMEAWVAWRAFQDRGEPDRAAEAFALRAPTTMAAKDVRALRALLGVAPRGRPPEPTRAFPEARDRATFLSTLTRHHNEAAKRWGSRGVTKRRVADLWCIGERTLDEWLERHEVDWREYKRSRA